VSEDEYNFYYKAQTLFFSIFAIVGVVKSQQTEKSILPLPQELQEEKVHKEETSTEIIQPQKEQETQTGFILLIVFIVITMIGLGCIVFRKFKRIRERNG
jgi:hypothetical protein